MRRLLLPIAALLLAGQAAAQGMPPGGGGGPGGGGPGGGDSPGMGPGGPGGGPRPPRPPKPIKREKFDDAVTQMFRAGDANADGYVTLRELEGIVQQRRDVVIQARFRRVDTDGNGRIEAGEFTAWQRQMGSVALSESQVGADFELVPEVIEPELDDDDESGTLRRLVAPLSANVIVEANTDYDAGATLAELLAYQGMRFDAADLNADGAISMNEMISLEPRPGGRPPESPPGFYRSSPGAK